MATDFVQERRWKHATAKLVATTAAAAATVKRQQSQMADAATTATDTMEMETASEEKGDRSAAAVVLAAGNDTGDDNGSKTIDKDDAAMVMDGAGGNVLVVVDEDDPLAEETAARKVAQTLSQRIAELALQSSSSQLQEGVVEVGEEEEEERDGEVDTSRMAENGEEANNTAVVDAEMDVVPVDRKTALERTSKFVQDILDTLQEQNDDNEDGTTSTTTTTNTKVSSKRANKKASASETAKEEDEPLSLLPSQRTVVRRVEQRWRWQRQSSKTSAVGSILRGTVASGKTIVTATLLWRRRTSGPQLLVCSSARMVRLI